MVRLAEFYPYGWIVNLPNTRAGLDRFAQGAGWADLYYGSRNISAAMADVGIKLKAGK